ncbi:hypothetical protein QR77_38065 [Streptomyces sp. 150FB]|nr:hypothetical protein QR77_38065 [Streptomyces sp. 150FB]
MFPLMAAIACAALLPGEAVRLRVDDVTFSEGGGSEVLVRSGEGRKVPAPSALVGVLRWWIDRANLKPGDLLFPDEHGGPLSPSVYRKAWKQAREGVLTPDELEAGQRGGVTRLRDSCLDLWLKAGVPAWLVAEWAGVKPSWLALRYPHRFRPGQFEIDWDHLAAVMELPKSPNP